MRSKPVPHGGGAQRCLCFFIAMLAGSHGWWPAAAADVTIGVVVEDDTGARPLDAVQAVWRSPIGGWVVATAPFGLRVGERPFLEFRTAAEKIAAESTRDGDDARTDGLVEQLEGGDGARSATDQTTFRFDRPASALVAVGEGRRSITPFDIPFEVGADGVPRATDPRLRVDAARRRIDIICHPVTIRTVAANRTVTAPLAVAGGGRALLGGLPAVLDEYERLAEPWRTPAGKGEQPAFSALTLFLPATADGPPYEVAGRRFTVAADGRITLDPTAQAARVVERSILLEIPATAAVATRPVAVQWRDLAAAVRIAVAGGQTIAAPAGSAAAMIDVSAPGPTRVALGGVTVAVPAATADWPHTLLLWNAAAKAVRCVEAASMAAQPGGEWRCRITRLNGTEPPLRDLEVRIEPADVDRPATDGPAVESPPLVAGADGICTVRLPQGRGLHRIVAVGSGPLSGFTLGYVWLADRALTGSLSLFTVHNRGLVRRGDRLDVLFATSGDQPLAETAIVLRGAGVDREIGRIAGRSGAVRLDTTALAPGTYEVTATATGDRAVYPLRFRVVQREPRSGFARYASVYGPARPMGGSPVSTYYERSVAGDPGLTPFLGDVTAAADAVLAAYASAPAGPAVEKCRPLPAEEAALLALAAIGGCGVPTPPQMLHHEDWNPKHTLPEDLAQMRRRLALFTQPRADVAGFAGFALNWFGSLTGYWEESPPLDGHQARRNAAAKEWIDAEVERRVAEAKAAGANEKQLAIVRPRANLEASSAVLPAAYAEWLADALAIRPGLTSHSGIPSFWLGRGHSFPPVAYASLSHRDAVDYTDYGITPWGNFRVPAFLAMGNPARQETRCAFMTAGRPARIATAFGAAGRGLDGLSLTLADEHPTGEDAALLAIFERFGPFFSALDPLPDVGVYFNGWSEQAGVILHDLARLRRPGVLLSPADVRAGKLAGLKAVVLASIGAGEPADVMEAFARFVAEGGTILKDGGCDARLPGRQLGFAYDDTQVHRAWGLAYTDGEAEFAHLWRNFKSTREAPLVAAFAAVPPAPVSTPSPDVVLAPLAAAESIVCFSINQTLVPLDVPGKWRQNAVLPCTSTLLVAEGWHVHDLLAGKGVAVADTPTGRGVPLDFTRCEGAIHLLTRRRPAALAIRTDRSGPHTLKLAAWLADAADAPLPDPLPFEVTLREAGGQTLFHAFVAASPTLTVDVPVPASAASAPLELVVRDLVIGSTATQAVEPATAATIAAAAEASIVGDRAAVAGFCAGRQGPVTILLDEGQEPLRPAVDALAKLLAATGRESRIVVLDPTTVRPLPLRWVPRPEDEPARAALRTGGLAWRIDLGAVPDKTGKRVVFDDPRCGYAEYGPRLACDTDVVLFGLPETHRAIDDVAPFLRRRPTAGLPAAESFWVEHLESPFQAGRDGLFVACRDPAGALAAVERIATLEREVASPAAAPPTTPARPVETRGGPATQPADMIAGRFGTRILDAAFLPDGRIVVTADSYGDSLFIVDETGRVIDARPLGNRCGNTVWSTVGGRLSEVTAAGCVVTQGTVPCRYDFARGLVGRRPPVGHGFTGRFTVPIAAATVLDDPARGRRFGGGPRRVRCLEPGSGRLLWEFDDAALRTDVADLLHLRSLFPRAVSPDGRQVLVAGFAIQHDTYGRGKPINASLLALDAATGKQLWQQPDLLLNEGKVIPLDGRFLVIDDTGAARVLAAADGRVQATLPPVQGSDWILPVPGRDAIVVVENGAFDREGRAARVYLRPLAGGPDRPLAVAGRVTDIHVAADGAITLATERGKTQRFTPDGAIVWEAATPPGGIVRSNAAGTRLLVGSRAGVAHLLDARDGASLWTLDLNPFNVTTGERFRTQQAAGELPIDPGSALPDAPPAESWLAASPAPGLTFGKPLVPRGAGGGQPVAFAVERGKTYLVEVSASCGAAGRTPLTRLEIEVAGMRAADAAGPFRARLPVDDTPARRRVAFRAERSGQATIRVRAVEPTQTAAGRAARLSYDTPAASPAQLAVQDLVVAEMRFPGRDIVFEGGPTSASRPLGAMTCQVKPWTGGNSTLRNEPYACPTAALRIVNGRLDDRDAAWTEEATGDAIHSAEARVKFAKPQTVAAVAVYEDVSGPVPRGGRALETAAPRFAVFAKEARGGRWRRLGARFDNVDLVTVFPGADVPVDELLYVWAGREATGIDGLVRPTEIEVYAGDELEALLDEPAAADDPLDL